MRRCALVLALLAGCTGEITSFETESAATPDGAVAPPPRGDAGPTFALAIVEPQAGAEIARDLLQADGSWVALFHPAASAAPAATVDWLAGTTLLGTGTPPDYRIDAVLAADGAHQIDAVARDSAGHELGRARVAVLVTRPTAGSSCLEKLDALGIDYRVGPAAQGVATPVTVTLPLDGLVFKNSSGTVRQTLYLDCQLALALWRTAEAWKARGVVSVVDYGIYNYRCIDQSVQPPCPGSTLSQHAFAMAIDIGVLVTGDGTRYVVNDDWIIEDPPSGQNTCTVEPAAGAKNLFLHRALCQLYDLEVFKILLTPNYNAAHRNHFHLDLTPRVGSFVGKLAAALGLDRGPDDE